MNRTRRICLVLVACFVAGCGSTGPHIHDRPVDVRVETASGAVVVRDTVSYASERRALRNGRFSEGPGSGGTAELALERGAMHAWVTGEREEARRLFQEMATADDEDTRRLGAFLLFQDARERGAWPEVISRMESLGIPVPDLFRALATLPTMTVTPTDAGPIPSRIVRHDTGHALVEAISEGSSVEMVFDTGAGLTVLSDSAARSLGVEWDPDNTHMVTNSSGEDVPAWLGHWPAFRLGNVRVDHLPVLVFPVSELSFERDDRPDVVLSAILGWDVIRYLDVAMDLQAGSYIARVSNGVPSGAPNLFWMGYPVVRAHADSGQPLQFGLDTGSQNSSVTPNLFRKVDVGSVDDISIRTGGVGGWTVIQSQLAESVTIRLPGGRISFEGIWTESESGAGDVFYFMPDGILGIDVAGECGLHINPASGIFNLVDCP